MPYCFCMCLRMQLLTIGFEITLRKNKKYWFPLLVDSTHRGLLNGVALSNAHISSCSGVALSNAHMSSCSQIPPGPSERGCPVQRPYVSMQPYTTGAF